MNRELIFNLINKIYSYYPIGMPHLNDQYPGYHKLLAILEEKINGLIEKKVGPWDSLVASVNGEFDAGVRDEAYHQFPSYVLRIEMNNEMLNEFNSIENVYLIVSLLTKHYTVYIKRDLNLISSNTRSLPFSVINLNRSSPNEERVSSFLKEETTRHFPEHSFVPHHLLFNYKIEGGLPHGEALDASNKSYPIFNFLFGFFEWNGRIEIQE